MPPKRHLLERNGESHHDLTIDNAHNLCRKVHMHFQGPPSQMQGPPGLQGPSMGSINGHPGPPHGLAQDPRGSAVTTLGTTSEFDGCKSKSGKMSFVLQIGFT